MKRSLLRSLTWLKYGRKYSAPLEPFRIIWVSPTDIQQYSRSKPKTVPWLPAEIIEGDWDRELNWFENGVVFRSFRNRFINNKDWSETLYHQFAIEQIEKKGHYKGYETFEGVRIRCQELDKLFSHISKNGYLTQSELDQTDGLNLHRHLHLPPEMREVTIDISRTGNMLWRGGAHRLAMTKLLDIDEIPVRVNIRHKSWQELRDYVYNGGSVDDSLADHPDLQF